MPRVRDKRLHNNVVVVDLDFDHLGSDDAALSPTPSGLSALGGTAPANQTQKPQDEWKPTNSALRMDVEVFSAFFNPIPFRPVKTLDFDKHEIFLKHLGLWDFIHLDYDFDIRADLLRQVVLNFDPEVGFSTVDGMSIEIGRMAIACALKLPEQQVEIDTPLEVIDSESIEFVEEFVMNWMLLCEDAWVMPEEVLEWTGHIREGKLDEVDWAELMWFMVKRELVQLWELGSCYYASHLQLLMKFQKPGLFEERAKVEGNGRREKGMGYDEAIKLEDDDDDEQDVGDDVNMIRLDDEDDDGKSDGGSDDDDSNDDDDNDDDDDDDSSSDDNHDAADSDDNIQELEDQSIGLQLDSGKIENDGIGGVDVMNLQECEGVEPEYWLLNEMAGSGGHFMQQCNQNEIQETAFQSKRKAGGKEIYDISMKCGPVEGFASGNCVQYIGTKNLHSNPHIHNREHSTEEPFASRTEPCVNVGNPFMSNNSLKRRLEHQDENDHLCHNYHSKRKRNGNPSESLEFDFCMEQIQLWMDKARMAYISREQACRTAKTNEQVLRKALKQQEIMIEHLERTKRANIPKREVEVHNLTSELHFMGNLVDGYKSALKKTQKLFSEYRDRCQLPEEPLYRDAVRTGGVVLSNSEFKNLALQQEEEERALPVSVDEKISEFQLKWFDNLQACLHKINVMDARLLDSKKKVEFLKEIFREKLEQA